MYFIFRHFVLSMPDESITKVEFLALLKKKKIKKLDQDLIKELCNRFATKNQNVDCVEMKKVYMQYYPDTFLPPAPPKKKKGKKGKNGKGKKTEEAETPVQQETSTTEKQSEEQITEDETKCAIPTETVPETATEEVPTALNTKEDTNENQID